MISRGRKRKEKGYTRLPMLRFTASPRQLKVRGKIDREEEGEDLQGEEKVRSETGETTSSSLYEHGDREVSGRN